MDNDNTQQASENHSITILRNNDKIDEQDSSIVYDNSGEITAVNKRKNLVEQAYERLFPDKKLIYGTKVKFSSKFKDYNANIRQRNNLLELRLCRKWKHIDKEIVLGLVQSLLLKILDKDMLNDTMFDDESRKKGKKKIESINIDLYDNFVKNLHIAAPKDRIDSLLLESFNRVNEAYFFGQIECPNLIWGSDSIRKLGSYGYKTDIITISDALRNSDREMLDYIMYHEMLHKKFKFSSKGTKNRFHSREFKDAEKKFENAQEIERKLKFIRHRASKQPSRVRIMPSNKKRGFRILDLLDW